MLAALAPATAAPAPRHVALATALDALLRSGAIGERERAAGLAYARLRARWERVEHLGRRGGRPVLSDGAYGLLKRRHAALLDAAGFDRFVLDRVVLDDELPLGCEVGRVGEARGAGGGDGWGRAGRRTEDAWSSKPGAIRIVPSPALFHEKLTIC